jgi:hypothetical protein
MDEISAHRRFAFLSFAIMVTSIATGCRQISAPIHVWSPPRLQSAVGHRIAIAPVSGDSKIAGPLHTAMMTLAPQDAGRTLYCIDTRSLESTQSNQTIRLVSAIEGETSDIAMHSLAKRNDVDFLLTGEIVRQPRDERKANLDSYRGLTQPETPEGTPTQDPEVATVQAVGPGYLAVSWKLVDVRGGTPVSGMPIVTHHDAALDPQSIASAAAADAWKLITPFVQADSVELAATRLSFGSERLRRGNQAAIDGDWQRAEELWNQVLQRQPSNHAALHNLAIAAVARQDYEAARSLIGKALKLRNKPLYRESAVWIEARQRDYHEAFQLPDPVGGWAATRR